MRKNLGILLLLVIVGISLGAWGGLLNSIQLQSLKPRQGLLAAPMMTAQNLYRLRGEWAYYPSQLADGLADRPDGYVQVQHSWPKLPGTQNEFGFATYRVILNGLETNRLYGFFIQDEFSAYRLSVNGVQIASNGQVGKSRETYRPAVHTETGYFKPDARGQAEVIMEIANFDRSNGGFYNAPLLGFAEVVSRYYLNFVSLEVFIIAFMLALGLFFAILSIADHDRHIFLMAVFAIVCVLRIVSTGSHVISLIFPLLPLQAIIWLEYLSGYLLIPLALMLFNSFGLWHRSRWLHRILIVSIPAIILFVVLVSNYVLTRSYDYLRIAIALIAFYCVWLLFQGIRKREPGITYVVLGFLALIIGGLNEISPVKIYFGLSFATMAFMLLLSVFVVLRFASVKQRNQSLEFEVLTDALTGLGSRTALFKALDNWQLRRDKAHLQILFMDLNRFKQINDTHGHVIGDSILRQSARRLLDCVRTSDQIFRFGGDEFVILAELSAESDEQKLADRIKEAFQVPILIDGQSFSVGISIGCEQFRQGIDTADEVIVRSDKRMYNV